MRRHTTRLLIVGTLAGCRLFKANEPESEPEWRTFGSVTSRWTVDIPGADPHTLAPPPIATPEGIVIPTGDGRLLSLDAASGVTRWSTASPSTVFTGQSMAYRDGRVIAPVTRGAVAVDARTGQLQWFSPAPLDARVSALNGFPGDLGFTGTSYVDADPVFAYLPAWGGTLSALDPRTGQAAWVWSDTMLAGNPAGATGAAVSGDTVYVHGWYANTRGQAPSDLWVVAMERATGRTLWRRQLPERGAGTLPAVRPIVWRDLLLIQQGGSILALQRATGSTVWTFAESGRRFDLGHMAMDGDRLYFCSAIPPTDAEVVALDARTGVATWRTQIYFAPGFDLVVSSRRVYAVNNSFVNILDRTTGDFVARLGARLSDREGFSSSAVIMNGNVFIRQASWLGNGQANVSYKDALWSFVER